MQREFVKVSSRMLMRMKAKNPNVSCVVCHRGFKEGDTVRTASNGNKTNYRHQSCYERNLID